MSFLDFLIPDPEQDFYTPGFGYFPSVARRGISELFSSGKRAVDTLATEAYKSEPIWDPREGRMVMQDRPGLENLDTIPVEDMLTNAVGPELDTEQKSRIPTPYQNLYNLGRGGLKATTRFAMDPFAYGMNLPGKAGALAAGYFGVEGGIGAYEKGKEALEAPNLTEAIEPGVESLANLAMSTLGARHAGREVLGRNTTKPPIIPDTPEKVTGPFEVPSEAASMPKPKEHVLEDLVLGPEEVYNRRYQNMTQEYVDRIKPYVAEVLQNPEIMNVKVELLPDGDTTPASYNAETKTMYINPKELARGGPEYMMNTISHELGHNASLHSFENIGVTPAETLTPFQERIMDKLRQKGESPEEIAKLIPNRAYTPMGEGKFAEIPPEHISHTEENITERAKYSPEEHLFQTARDSIANDPRVRELGEKYKTNISKLTADEFARARGLEPSEVVEGPVSAHDMPASKGISEPANILRQILTEGKITKFNKNTLLAELEAKGVPVPDEMKAEIPKLLDELKSRGWVNEKIAGTMSLQVEPPKRLAEIGESKPVYEPVNTLEQQLKASLKGKTPKETLPIVPRTYEAPPSEPKKTPPTTVPKEGEKLTRDEIRAIGKLFGDKVKTRAETPDKIKSGELEGEEKPKIISFKVTLSDGSEHIVKAPTPEQATERANQILEAGGSTKTVTNVEEKLSTLEQAAKEEISSLKTGTERVAEDISEGKKTTSTYEKVQESDIKSQLKVEEAFKKAETQREADEIKAKQQLTKAQTKEKLAKKSFTVKLSNDETYSIRARNEQRAREYVEDKIRKSKSGLTITSVSEKLSKLETALSGGGKKPPKEPPKFGRESITPEDSFSQAWNKLTATEKVSEVGAIIKAMRSSGDLGHILRQGKLMTVDFLTTGNAKMLGNALRTMKEATFSEAKFKEINEGHAKNPITSKLVTDFGLDLPGIAGHLKEEAFHAGTAEKIPGLGKILIKPSERAYTSFLNEARVSEAKRLVKIAEDAGFNMDANPEVYKSLMKAVNIVSSRGHFEKMGPALNELSNLMWAPRLKLSRAQLIASALGGGEMHPLARVELRKSLGRTVAVNMALLGLASLAGKQVETDPRNSDWGRIVVGNTRIDPWFGLQPIVRSAVLLYLGETKSATTGRTKPVSPAEVIGRQFTSGLAPGPAYAYEQATGKSITGFPIDKSERALLGVSPLIVEDIYEALQQYGMIGGLGVGALGVVGEGVSTYEEPKAKKSNTSKSKTKRSYPYQPGR